MSFEEEFEEFFEENLEDESSPTWEVAAPGYRILEAVDKYLPDPVSPLKLSITASCLVEDLSLLYPQISIELGRATIGNEEAFVPVICDLQIFNSPDIGRFSESCVRIPDSAITNGSVKETMWYQHLVEEIADALEDYVFALPLTAGNVPDGAIPVLSNFRFEIPPGERKKIFTNFRMPQYKAMVKAQSSYTLKKSVFSSGENEQPSTDEFLEEIASHFPHAPLARPGKNKIYCSNKKIVDWVVERLPEKFRDHCFEGLFSYDRDRVKLTILNNTNETIVVEEGGLIASFKVTYKN